MNVEQRRTSRLGNQRGSVLVIVVLGLVVFLGMAALAIDLGIMYVGRSEAQRSAEAGAHAGAGVFLYAPGDEPTARSEAEVFAEANQVRWGDLDVWPDEDIDVILDSQKVRVRTYRTDAEGRENPVATIFARILGIFNVNISAVAAAQVWAADRTECLLPFAIPDRWEIDAFGTPASASDVWEGPPDHLYEECDWDNPDGGCTGYSVDHIGTQIVLKMASPRDSPQPGWYYPVRLPGMSGANDYRNAIADCWEESAQYTLGEPLDTEQGNMRGPTAQGFERLTRDTNLAWDDVKKCPVNGGNPNGGCAWDDALAAKLWRPLPMFEPPAWEFIDPGKSSVPIINFGGVFIPSDAVDPATDDVRVHIVPFPGFTSAQEWTDSRGSLIRTLRIVE